MQSAAAVSFIPHVEAADTASTGLYRNIWKHAAGARLRLVFAMGLLVGSQLVKLAAPWFAAQAMNTLQKNETDALLHAGGYVMLVLLTFVLAWAMHGPGRVLEREVGLRVRQSFADSLYAKLLRLPMSWHDRNHSGDVQLRVSQSTGALYGFAQSQFTYLQSAVNLIGPLVALTLFSQALGLMALVGYAAIGYVILRFDFALMRLASAQNTAERHYQAGMLDFLGNMSTVLSLRLGQSTRELLGKRLLAVFQPLRRSILLTEVRWCAVDLLGIALTWALVAAFVALTGRSGSVLLMGSVFMVYQYAQQAGGVIGSIANNFQGLARTRADFASAEPIWQAKDRPEPGDAVDPQWQRIEIRELCYEHSGLDAVAVNAAQAAPVRPSGLHHVALTLERGERVALVGPSGSGKSTLMRVLAGLYSHGGRCIEIDGQPQPGVRHFGSIATLIPQEADVFEATVRENIAFGGTCDEAELVRAIHVSAFDAVMADMAQGLDTPIKERGFNLSGGQRQRLCLARGVLAARSSSLVMLDEPTSALDPVTEDAVLERMAEAFEGACLVASVHRMSLLRHFDKVVLMAAGRVVDVGTTEELQARQPAFRQMLRQSKGAEEAESVFAL
ncbi:MAG TPA: ABC transporter ATP-binding protein [Burkholderiaceae bacterium]|nr:ABC transporter ATP-binding protein [Burkholderiaceae bacterium]